MSDLVRDVALLDNALPIVCVEGAWRIVVFVDGVRDDFQCTSLQEACEFVIAQAAEGAEQKAP